MAPIRETASRGVALLAVLFALVLLSLLALPFAVSMGVGADAAKRGVEQTEVGIASASVRELLLADAAMSHPSVDPTPTFDGLDEWPAGVELPPAFADLTDEGRVLLGGAVVDLQRFVGLDGVSPLLLANAIGATTRLAKDLLPEANVVEVADASGLPDEGTIWVADELIHYGAKDGNQLRELERGMQAPEFADGKQPIAEDALVLDFRCVLASCWPWLGHGNARRKRQPFRAVGELLEMQALGHGSFSAAELDRLHAVFSTDTMAATAATWGRPERVFSDLESGKSKSLTVKSALHLGAGSTVRITNQRTGAIEYGLVMSTQTQQGVPELSLPSRFTLTLLFTVQQSFPAVDTVIEPLIPAPVNVNTASLEVLLAACANVRQAGAVRMTEDQHQRSSSPRDVGRSEALALAMDILAQRTPSAAPGQGPFRGWRDFAERVFKPRFDAARSNQEKQAWVAAYRNLQTGRDSVLEMGTTPITFRSGPWVAYRAAASRSRSVVAAGVVGRHERSGIAAAMPGFTLQQRWSTQEAFEEAFQLDRRSPFWTTHPINLGALQPGDIGNDPAPRFFPHVVPMAYPDLGFGPARFAATDDADAGIEPAPATAISGAWAGAPNVARAAETFAQALDVRGHDVGKLGAYTMNNTGPRPGGTAGQGSAPSVAAVATRGRHDKISFPFSNPFGFTDRFATSFWLEPSSLEGVVVFDHGDGDAERNRLSLQGREGNLVLEVIDEAGLDPNPSASPAGIERTASEWRLPLAELGLPADTPVHLAASAFSGRPGDLSLAVDGMTRGKPRYVTHLTAAIPVFDPNLANNQRPPDQPGNERYLDLQVDSTEGFPSVGVLRVGLELFEYSSIQGNSFRCRFVDSLGGRGARQAGRENRPDIPVDGNGEPTVNLDDPQFQGVTLDVFPEHRVGSAVELYGYAALLSEDSPMMARKTALDGSIGGFAVARGFIDNPRPIVIQMSQGPTFLIGVGIDENWTGELHLADPLPTPAGESPPNEPPKAQQQISEAFAVGGGYALLVQVRQNWDRTAGSATGRASFGGVELLRYAARQDHKLTGVQRAQQLPGQDGQISSDEYDGRPRRFVTNYEDYPLPNNPQILLDHLPTLILWVVPVSLPVQSTATLPDPQSSLLSEWVQLYPRGGDVNDTEWVRYDCIAQNRWLVRANRAAWDDTRYALTQRNGALDIQLGPLGPNSIPTTPTEPPWGSVQPTSGWIGYTPQLESTFPQIHAARRALEHRGDPFTGTSSHPQTSADVLPCHRLQLLWGNYGAYTGRVGRNDRVAVVQGRSGTGEPAVEWHTVNWQARRYYGDNLDPNQTPPERLGPWPFQLVAFQDEVRIPMLGPPQGTVIDDPRRFDRIVKFPSGELPAAYCENPSLGAGIGNSQPMRGLVDEVELTGHFAHDLLLDEALDANARTFRVQRGFYLNSAGAVWTQTDLSATFPALGGLVAIDGEVLAYQGRADGVFTIAVNGRGLLNTEARGHDRGARVRFLTHRPAAILTGSVGVRDSEIPLASVGALPRRYGTVLLGRELLHYTWVRTRGDLSLLEMPRWFPHGGDRGGSQTRGLFRGRYGTSTETGGTGEVVIGWPFRYWDRHVPESDDPELAYFQCTINEAPALFRGVRWREEVRDARVEVSCLVRADGKLPWEGPPLPAGGYWHLRGGTEQTAMHRLGHQASRLELRFVTTYRPGCVDLTTFRAHGWKTTARIKDVRVEYEGQGRVFDEQVSAR
jgi:hypothetical protein